MSWTLVQSAVANNVNSASSASATFTNPVGSGNLVVGLLAHLNSTLGTITDDKSNTYTAYKNVEEVADTCYHVAFELENITNGPKTVTVNTSSGDYLTLIIAEFSGGGSAGTDGTPSSNYQTNVSGSANDCTSGNITTTVAGDLIVGTCMDGSHDTNPTAGTGFTLVAQAGNSTAIFAIAMEYLVQASAGAIAATFTVANGENTVTAVNAFKAAAGGSPTYGYLKPNFRPLLRR